MESSRDCLRHAVATLAYRANRALENAPAAFASFDGGGRQPVQILAHMGDLFDWALSMAEGNPRWNNSQPLEWTAETQRYYAALGAFDEYLASPVTLNAPVERLLQGPVADALTHVGQLAMLRRMADCPTRGENFYVAEIACGKTGPDQPAPVKTF
jgi:hypothetical protein